MSCHERGHARPPIRALLGPIALFAAATAGAANWEIAPRVQVGYRYNDNYRLDQPGQEIQVSGADGFAALTFRNIDPRTHIEVTPSVQATYFPDEPEEDSVDYFLRGLIADETPRRRIGITGDFSEEDVVRSEFPDVSTGGDLGDPQALDSGRVIQRNRRRYMRVDPFYQYALSQRHRLELDAHYLQADFDEQQPGAQQDFSEAAASAGFAFLLSQRSSVTLRAIASQYETTFKTDAYGGQVEWTNDFSPTSRMYVRIGGQETKPEDRQSDTNFISGIGGRFASPRNTFFVDLTRTVGPVAAGTIVARHQLRLRIDHDVSPRLALQFGARAARDEEVGSGGTYPTRKYATAEAGFEWRMQRQVALTATYSYRWQEYADEPSDASSNGFLIGVVYEPKRPE